MNILLVDDEQSNLPEYKQNLELRFQEQPIDDRHEIICASTMEDARGIIENKDINIDIAILDLNMTGGGGTTHGGLDLLEDINRLRPGVVSIVWTAYTQNEKYLMVELKGLFAYVNRHEDSLEDIVILIRKAFEQKEGVQYINQNKDNFTLMKALGIQKGEITLSLVENVPMPRYLTDMIVARTIRLGICGTDMHNYINGLKTSRDYHLIEFHEAIGEIVATGADVSEREFKIGDWVVPVVRRCQKWERKPGNDWDFHIKKCSSTRACSNYHRPDMCLQRPGYLSRGTGKYHGFGSEYFSDHVDYLVKVTESQKAKLDKLCVLAEPISVAWKLMRLISENRRIKPGDKILVAGIGPIGMACLAVLRWMHPGPKLHALDIVKGNHIRVKILSRHFGNTVTYIETNRNDRTWPIGRDNSHGEQYDIVIDATGDTANVFPKALASVKPEGILGLLGISGDIHSTGLTIHEKEIDNIITSEIKVIGSVCASKQDMEETLWFMETQCPKKFLQDMVFPRKPLAMDKAVDELNHLNKTKNYIKIVIDPI